MYITTTVFTQPLRKSERESTALIDPDPEFLFIPGFAQK